jgi:hypothetical protein
MPEVRGSLSWVSGAPPVAPRRSPPRSNRSAAAFPILGVLPVGSARCSARFSRWSRQSCMVAVDRPLWRRGRSPTTPVCADVDHALQLVAPRLGRRGRRCPENALNAIDPIVFRRQFTVLISSLATADPRLSLVAGPMVTESDRLRTSKGHPPCHPNALIWPHFARSSRRTAPARCSQRHGQPTWRSCGFGLGGSAAICSSG